MKSVNRPTSKRKEVATSTVSATAVAYLRVSTPRQAKRGGEPEGFSLPAQRRLCQQLADARVARFVAEFVDPGESATTANRPEFQRMLAYVTAPKVDYVIFYSLDRL